MKGCPRCGAVEDSWRLDYSRLCYYCFMTYEFYYDEYIKNYDKHTENYQENKRWERNMLEAFAYTRGVNDAKRGDI